MSTPQRRGGRSLVVRSAQPDPRASRAAQSASSERVVAVEDTGAGVGHPDWPRRGRTVHTLCTSNGSPYTNFQNRIMYATYKLSQKMPGGDALVAFTRILHRSSNDEVVQARLPSAHLQPSRFATRPPSCHACWVLNV